MPDDTLLDELKNALAHLYDPSYLETDPLAGRIGYSLDDADLSIGQRLRRALRLGIEALDPGSEYPPHAPESRPYQVMRQYYIARREMSEIASTLAISERQSYRELRRGVEALANILFPAELVTEGERAMAEPSPEIAQISRIREEVERVNGGSPEHLDLAELLLSALGSVTSLAERGGIDIVAETVEGLSVSANRVMLRQALVNLMSYALRIHQGRELRARLVQEEEDACLFISLEPAREGGADRPAGPREAAQQLFAILDSELKEVPLEDDTISVCVRFHLSQKHSLLVVDDCVGAAQLLRSYLRGQPYTVHAIADPNLAFNMVEQLAPDVIILDVMMPDLDGWEFLERVRQTPAGRKALIIVSSVINDPELAFALGADAFLHKPLDRSSLIQTLAGMLSSTI